MYYSSRHLLGFLLLMVLGQGGVMVLRSQPYGLEQRPVVSAFANGALPPAEAAPAGWQAVVAFPNLTFDDPMFLVPEPGTNRLYVGQRQGKIFFLPNRADTTNKTLFLDLTAQTQGYNDCGLLGMAFHPQYGVPGSPQRGFVYLWYSYSPAPAGPGAPDATPNYNRLSRFTVPDGASSANPGSELVLLNQHDRHLWHNGGGMFFGPDGFLYLSLGDEGSFGDALGQAQRINASLFSGVIRIDVDRDPARSHPIRRQPVSPAPPPAGWPPSYTANYYIPNDNPWLDSGGSVLEEFYAIGLRSPHRMTYDALADRIWLGDVGQGSWEEVDLIAKGGNYQWAYREGSQVGYKAKPNPLLGVDRTPVYDYAHADGNNCVIGGYVYRGAQFPSLYGRYLFGDNGSGRVWAMTYDGVNPTVVTQLCVMPAPPGSYGLGSFGVDHAQELYLLVAGPGTPIYKLAAAGNQPPAPPALLSQTGVFTNLLSLEPSPFMIPYTVNTPLWSDRADKGRWMIVPTDGAPYGPAETIGFSSNGNWSFPTGTVFVKHFELPLNETNAALTKRLETRFMVHATNGQWYGLTYKWRADGTDADLLPGGLNETNFITTASGIRPQVWYYPSRPDCRTCHNANAGAVLGPRTAQFNGTNLYPATGVSDQQLRTLNHLGLFNTTLNESNLAAYPQMVPLDHPTASLESKVRSYLESNCAFCHQPNGVRGLFDARFSTPLADQGIVSGPVVDPLGVAGAKVVQPQDLSRSILHLRDSAVGGIQMPPLARNVVDEEYLAVLTNWINSLPLPPEGLPVPWEHQDVGPVGVAGDASHAAGVFTVSGSGVDIWGTQDSFHLAYRPLLGDAVFTVKVESLVSPDPWALAGVMIRQNLTAGSPHALLACTPSQGISFTRRTSAGASSLYTAGANVAVPYWVRLTRVGNVLTAYQSANGTLWVQVGTPQTITMTGTVYAGLAMTSHQNDTLGSAVFSNVLLTGPNVNNPPLANADALVRFASQGVHAPGSALLSNDTDWDGDGLTLTQVFAPIPPGATVAWSNGTVRYWPAWGDTAAGAFSYVISDGRGGSATGLVNVTVAPEPPAIEVLAIETSPGTVALSFTGVAGFTYTIQFSASLSSPVWQNLGVATADGSGHVGFVDPTAGSGDERFYRAVRGVAP